MFVVVYDVECSGGTGRGRYECRTIEEAQAVAQDVRDMAQIYHGSAVVESIKIIKVGINQYKENA